MQRPYTDPGVYAVLSFDNVLTEFTDLEWEGLSPAENLVEGIA